MSHAGPAGEPKWPSALAASPAAESSDLDPAVLRGFLSGLPLGVPGPRVPLLDLATTRAAEKAAKRARARTPPETRAAPPKPVPPAAPPKLELAYRAILRLGPGCDAGALAEDAFGAWLAGKLDPAPLPEDWREPGQRRLGGLRVLVAHAHDAGAAVARTCLSLTEQAKDVKTRVSVLAFSDPEAAEPQSILVEVELAAKNRDEALRQLDPPEVLLRLLRSTPARDGNTRLRAQPKPVPSSESADLAAEVNEVFAAIMDERRTAAVMVASEPEGAAPGWADSLAELTAKSLGAAVVFVLSAAARRALVAELDAKHFIEPGSMRTFAPHVDPDEADDERRHRLLAPRSLERVISRGGKRFDEQAWSLARTARQRFLDAPLPADLQAHHRAITAAERRAERDEQARAETAKIRREGRGLARRRPSLFEEQKPRRLPLFDGGESAGVRARAGQPEVGEPAEGAERPAVAEEQAAPVAVGPENAEPENAGQTRELVAEAREPAEQAPAEPAEPEPHEPIPAPLAAQISQIMFSCIGVRQITEESVAQLDARITEGRGQQAATAEQLCAADQLLEESLDEITELKKQREMLELDVAVNMDRADRAEREVSFLRQRLHARGEHPVLPPEEEVWANPGDIDELLARISEGSSYPVYRRVRFTGDAKAVDEVRLHDTLGKNANRLWRFVCALHDYAELKAAAGFAGSFHEYLTREDVDGRKCSPADHAGRESDTVSTRPEWREQRRFPVPNQARDIGSALMHAHFKISTSDTFAPRMHYLDDTGKTGLIYIGYIGRHLVNTKT